MSMRLLIIAMSLLACSATQVSAHGIDAPSAGVFLGIGLSLVTGFICAVTMPGNLWQSFVTLCGAAAATLGTAYALLAAWPLLGDNGLVFGAVCGLSLCASLMGAILANKLVRKEPKTSMTFKIIAVAFIVMSALLIWGSSERLAIRFS